MNEMETVDMGWLDQSSPRNMTWNERIMNVLEYGPMTLAEIMKCLEVDGRANYMSVAATLTRGVKNNFYVKDENKRYSLTGKKPDLRRWRGVR